MGMHKRSWVDISMQGCKPGGGGGGGHIASHVLDAMLPFSQGSCNVEHEVNHFWRQQLDSHHALGRLLPLQRRRNGQACSSASTGAPATGRCLIWAITSSRVLPHVVKFR